MKAHKYWSLGALACMAGCFYTGCKKLMKAHKYFDCGSLVCMGMAIYSGHKIAPKKKKLKSLKNKNTRPRRNKRGLFELQEFILFPSQTICFHHESYSDFQTFLKSGLLPCAAHRPLPVHDLFPERNLISDVILQFFYNTTILPN